MNFELIPAHDERWLGFQAAAAHEKQPRGQEEGHAVDGFLLHILSDKKINF